MRNQPVTECKENPLLVFCSSVIFFGHWRFIVASLILEFFFLTTLFILNRFQTPWGPGRLVCSQTSLLILLNALLSSLVAWLVKNSPAMWEIWNQSLGWEDSPREGKDDPLQYPGLENSMDCMVHGVTKSWTQLSDFHFYFLSWSE